MAETFVALEPIDLALTRTKPAALHDIPEILPATLELPGSVECQVRRLEVRIDRRSAVICADRLSAKSRVDSAGVSCFEGSITNTLTFSHM